MTLLEVKQDLFEMDDSWYLAHCISADFALGAGIAKEFDRRFNMRAELERAFPNYRDVWQLRHGRGDALIVGRVINLVTKEKFWHKPTIESVTDALIAMRLYSYRDNIEKIAMPKIGCGLDRLQWDEVKATIQEVFQPTDVTICVCSLD